MNHLSEKIAKNAKKYPQVKYFPLPHNPVKLSINLRYINTKIAKTAKKCYHRNNARLFLQQQSSLVRHDN